jgi:hypothetical protein
VGTAFLWRADSRPVIRWQLSLLSLYVGATLFGIASGVYDLIAFDHTRRIWSALVIQTVLGTLWGVTFTGYILILWPLAYLNHWLLLRYANPSP